MSDEGSGQTDHTDKSSADRDGVPAAGETFMIINRADDRTLGLLDGKLHLEEDSSRAGNCYWRCVEKNGWLGFYETELGRYLGHDFWWKFTADASAHDEYQYFQPRKLPDGGYLLLAPRLGKMVQVSVGKDGDSLVATDKDGAAWDFVKA